MTTTQMDSHPIVPETQEDNTRNAAQILSNFAAIAADQNVMGDKSKPANNPVQDVNMVDATQLIASCGEQLVPEKRPLESRPEPEASTEKKSRTEIDLTTNGRFVVRPIPVPAKLVSTSIDSNASAAFKPIAEAVARCEQLKRRPVVAVPAKEFVFSRGSFISGQQNVVTIAPGPVDGVGDNSIVPFDRALSFDVMASDNSLMNMSALADVVHADPSKAMSLFVCRRSNADISAFDQMPEKSQLQLIQVVTSHHKFDTYLSILHNFRLQYSVQLELPTVSRDCAWNDTTLDFDTLWKTFDPSTFVLSIRMMMLPPSARSRLFSDAICNTWPMAVGFLKSRFYKKLLLSQLLCCAVLHPNSSSFVVAELLHYIDELNHNPDYAWLLEDGSFYQSHRSSQYSLTHKYCKLALLLSAIRFRPINAYWAVNKGMFGRYVRKLKLAAQELAGSVFYAEPIGPIVSLAATWTQLNRDEFMSKCIRQRKNTDCLTLDMKSQRTWIQPVGAWMNELIASIDNVDSMRAALCTDWSITWWRFFGFNSNYQAVYTALHMLVPIPHALFFQKVIEVASVDNALMLLYECKLMFADQISMFDDRKWRVEEADLREVNALIQYQRTGLKDVELRSRLRNAFYGVLRSFPGGIYLKSISPGAVLYPFGAVLSSNLPPTVKAGETASEDAVSASCDDVPDKDDAECKMMLPKEAYEKKTSETGATTLCAICQANHKSRCIFYMKKYYISHKLDALLENKQITADEASKIAAKLTTIPHESFEWAMAYACISCLVAKKATVERVMNTLNANW